MNCKVFSLLICLSFVSTNLFCMKKRPRSNSLSTSLSGLSRPRSSSFTVGARRSSSSPAIPKKRSGSNGGSLLKESSIVKKVRKAIASGKLTDRDVKSIEFFIAVYKDKKNNTNGILSEVKSVQKERTFSLDLSDLQNVEDKDKTGRTILYKVIEQANQEIKQTGTLSPKTESKLCLLLSYGADQDNKCIVQDKKTSCSPRQIASPKVKKYLTAWKKDSWSPRKDQMVKTGMEYWNHASKK